MALVGRLSQVLAASVVLILALGGCGSSARHGCATQSVGRDGPAAAPAQVAVVCHWAAALQAGDIKAAAGYFHLPSVFDDGATDTIEIRTLAEAEFVNASLPCGATPVSAFRHGRFIDVLFRLTARAGRGGGPHACGTGVGDSARTAFLIRDGRIVAWLRAPTLPGDPGVPGTSSKHSHTTTSSGTSTSRSTTSSSSSGLPA